jgi:hypothetical protein
MEGSGRRAAVVTKLISTLAIVVLGLVALGAVGPRIAAILNALVPLILVTAIAAAVLRVVWFYTRRW